MNATTIGGVAQIGRRGTLLRTGALAAMLAAGAGGTARAQLFWSANGSTIGGSGTWDTTNQRWDDTASGPFTTIWDNTANAGTQAFFQTTVGAVTVQAGGISVGTITPINASAANPWVFTGGAITLGSRIGPASGAAQMNASFSNNIVLPNATTFFFRGGASTLNISGQLSGAGKVTNDRGNDQHILTLTGDNSGWSGGMTMPGMNFVLGHNSALGTGLIEVSGASVISATTPLTAINNNFQHPATGAAGNTELITLSGNHAMTFNGNLSWSGGASANVNRGFNVTSTAVMTWNGVISQTHATLTRNLLKRGSGTLVLGGANSYLGTTTVEQGTLLINNTTGSGTGSNDVTVNSGATLGGTGTISLGSGKAVTVNGSLAPGNAGVGTLTVNGAMTLSANAGYTWQYLNGAGDLVDVNGTLTLPTVATVTVTGSGALPTTMTLFTADTITGTDLSGWTVTGLKDGKVQIVEGTPKSVVLKAAPAGTVIAIR